MQDYFLENNISKFQFIKYYETVRCAEIISKFMTDLTNEQQNKSIEKLKNELKQQKNTLSKLEKKINTLLDKNKLKKKTKTYFFFKTILIHLKYFSS
ncbi:MAG: hypothetical protein COA77_00590 [Thaumarchaeota archaeon]|nr:MAG: hypothetical protein COA77_00590 [Nitrososphaerota archaeon]